MSSAIFLALFCVYPSDTLAVPLSLVTCLAFTACLTFIMRMTLSPNTALTSGFAFSSGSTLAPCLTLAFTSRVSRSLGSMGTLATLHGFFHPVFLLTHDQQMLPDGDIMRVWLGKGFSSLGLLRLQRRWLSFHLDLLLVEAVLVLAL